MSDPGSILEAVNQHKRQQFETKLRQFKGDSEVQDPRVWTVDNYERHYHALRSTISDVETHLTDIDDRIAELEGGASRAHFTERIEEQVDDELWNKVHSKTLRGKHRITFARISEGWQELSRLRARKVAWKTYQLELARTGVVKLFEVAANLDELDGLDDMKEKIDELQELITNWDVETASVGGKQPRQQDGSEPSADEAEGSDESTVANPGTADSAGSDTSTDAATESEDEPDPDYLLKNRPADEQREVLEEMLEDERISSWNSGAKYSDVSRNGLKSVVARVEREEDVDIDITS